MRITLENSTCWVLSWGRDDEARNGILVVLGLFHSVRSLSWKWNSNLPFLQKKGCAPRWTKRSENVWSTVGVSPRQLPAYSSARIGCGDSPERYSTFQSKQLHLLILMPYLAWGKSQIQYSFTPYGFPHDSIEVHVFRILSRILLPETLSRRNL